jgi:hypothetical protein
LENIFTHIWKTDYWISPGSSTSKSGGGSTLEFTALLRDQLPDLLSEFNVTKFFDAPCGDFGWMKEVKFSSTTSYLGGDIVEPMIRELNTKYPGKFIHFDITEDVFPTADVWMCRDALFHLCYADVRKAINNWLRSDITYALLTNQAFATNQQDITTGDYRPLNLEIAPLDFPTPIKSYADHMENHPEKKYLNLYHRKQFMDR